MHRSRAVLRLALAVSTLALAPLQAQDKTDRTGPLRVPHTMKPLLIDCNDNATWANVPRITLSKESVAASGSEAKNPLALVFLMSDPSNAATTLPADVESNLDSFHAQYAFQWDENRLYGYVEVKEKGLDAGHPEILEDALRRSGFQAAFEDLFYSSVIVEVGAPSWRRWTTEMHVHVRSPNAKPMTSMFYGRTNDEEDFRKLGGEAIACPTSGGWIAKFQVAWLPFEDWYPKSGVTADIRLLAPLAHAHEGYVVASVVPFILTN